MASVRLLNLFSNSHSVYPHSHILKNVGMLYHGDMKTAKQLERHLKGISNHRRIDILRQVHKSDGITLEEIADELDCNIKTISEHTRRLVQAGLVNKKYRGRNVAHSLSPYGRRIIAFIDAF